MSTSPESVTRSLYADAGIYDQLFSDRGPDAEVEFCRELVRQQSASLLELACGTGRVTIPLAQAGFEVVGIDTAEPMLAVARSKLANASANVNFMVGDMRSFNLRARFQLIFVPNNSLGHLLTLEDLRAMLSCVRSHLRRDGVFVIDYFNPSLELLTRSETETHPVTSFRNSAGELVNVTERVRYEAAAQVNHITWLLTQQGEPEQRLSFTLRVYFPMELDAALTLCGFKILAKYGSFAKEPFCSSSKQQVIVCADAA